MNSIQLAHGSGGLAMRAQDEQIPLRHGVVGQETCGPGGFAFALRSIPDMLAIGEDVRRYAPDAWILNYSNPAAILADLWHKRFPELKSLFICDMPIVIELLVAATLGYRHADLAFEYVGLNHFGWWRHIWNPQGEDLLHQRPETGEIEIVELIKLLHPRVAAVNQIAQTLFQRLQLQLAGRHLRIAPRRHGALALQPGGNCRHRSGVVLLLKRHDDCLQLIVKRFIFQACQLALDDVVIFQFNGILNDF